MRNLKKAVFITCFVLCFICSFGQSNFQKVDRAYVKELISDSSLETFYEKLLARYVAFDTTLTVAEYRLLYYGFPFQKGYSGYADHKKREINQALKDNHFTLAMNIADSVLSEIPISLSANYSRGLAMFRQNEGDSSYKKYRDRYYNLRDAIVSTGDGLTCETAFKTIFVSDEYDVMYNYFEIEKFTTQSLVGMCDVFTVTPSQYFKASELYFDTSESLLQMERLFNPGTGKKKKRKKNS